MIKRKVIASTLMASLVLGTGSAYAGDLSIYKDAPKATNWAYEGLEYAVSHDYIVGIDGKVAGNKVLSRAEMATIIVRAYPKEVEVKALDQYKDVQKGKWYYESVAKAHALGYLEGKSDNKMAPNDSVSRLESIVIMARVLGINDGTTEDIKSGENVPSWAVASVGGMIKHGIVKGDEKGKLNLEKKITRAEFARLLKTVAEYKDGKVEEPKKEERKPGVNPYLPTGQGGGSASSSLKWYYGDSNVDQRYYPLNTGEAFIHPPFFNAHIGIGVDEKGVIREIIDNDTKKRSGNEAFWEMKQGKYWAISNKKINKFIGKTLKEVKAMDMHSTGADVISGATSNGLALQEAIIKALESKNEDKEAVLGKKNLPQGAKLSAETPVVNGNKVSVKFTSTLPEDFKLSVHSVRHGSTNEDIVAPSEYSWDKDSKTLTLKAPKAGKYFFNIVDESGAWRSPNFESSREISYPYFIVEANASDKTMSFDANKKLKAQSGQLANILKNIDEVSITEVDEDGNVVMVERKDRQGKTITVPNTVEIEKLGHHGNINTDFNIIDENGNLNLKAQNRGKDIFEQGKRYQVKVAVYGYGEAQTEVNLITKASTFSKAHKNLAPMKSTVVLGGTLIDAEKNFAVTAKRVKDALKLTEASEYAKYGDVTVTLKEDVDRSTTGSKVAKVEFAFSDGSKVEMDQPVEVESLPIISLNPSPRMINYGSVKTKEYTVGEKLDLSSMKFSCFSFAKGLMTDGSGKWDISASQAKPMISYADLAKLGAKIVKKGTTEEFVNGSPITKDMVVDGEVALEVYVDHILATDEEELNRVPFKGVKATASVTPKEPQDYTVTKTIRIEKKVKTDQPSASFLAKLGSYFSEDGVENDFEIGSTYEFTLDLHITKEGVLDTITITPPNPLNSQDKPYWRTANRFFNELRGKTEDEIKALRTWNTREDHQAIYDTASSATVTSHSGKLEVLEAFKEFKERNK